MSELGCSSQVLCPSFRRSQSTKQMSFFRGRERMCEAIGTLFQVKHHYFPCPPAQFFLWKSKLVAVKTRKVDIVHLPTQTDATTCLQLPPAPCSLSDPRNWLSLRVLRCWLLIDFCMPCFLMRKRLLQALSPKSFHPPLPPQTHV